MTPELKAAVESISSQQIREYFLNNYGTSLLQQACAESYLVGYLHGIRMLDANHPLVPQLERVFDIVVRGKA